MSTTLNWEEDIITPLKNNNLILVLGPDFNNIRQLVSTAVLNDEKLKTKIAHYDKNSNIFLFNEHLTVPACGAAASNITSVIKAFFTNPIPEEKNIYKYIVQLPFSCIINLSPDEYLKNAFEKFHYKQQYGKYRLSAETQDSAQILDNVHNIESPVTYNLFGVYKESNSLIVTYQDLMKFFSQIFSKPTIDDKLKEYLKVEGGMQARPKQFIFLGFRYDTWHMQLIMQLLNIHRHNVPENINLNGSSEPQGNIVLEQIQQYFHINNHLFDETEFINQLYKECQQSPLDCIRYTQLVDFWKRVEPLVNADFMDEVFTEMHRRNALICQSADFNNQITSLKNEYNEYLQSNNINGIKSIKTRLIDLGRNNKECLL